MKWEDFHEYWARNNLKGDMCGLTECIIMTFAWMNW